MGKGNGAEFESIVSTVAPFDDERGGSSKNARTRKLSPLENVERDPLAAAIIAPISRLVSIGPVVRLIRDASDSRRCA